MFTSHFTQDILGLLCEKGGRFLMTDNLVKDG